jgi:hypothetical protein
VHIFSRCLLSCEEKHNRKKMKKGIFTGILIILIGFILMSTVTVVSADGGLFIPFKYFLRKMRRKIEEMTR